MISNTPKYSGSLHRAAGSTSPMRSTAKGKYYSAEEVYKIMRTSYEPKIQFLMQ